MQSGFLNSEILQLLKKKGNISCNMWMKYQRRNYLSRFTIADNAERIRNINPFCCFAVQTKTEGTKH